MSLPQQSDAPKIAPEIAATLGGRHIGVFGFDAEAAARIAGVLRGVGAVGTRFEETWLGGSLRLGDALLIRLEAVSSLALRQAEASLTPVLLAGESESLLEGRACAYEWPQDFLAEPWSDAELLVRLFRLIAPSRSRTHPEPRRQPLILIADDDSAWTSLVEATLRAHGLACRTAADGLTALRLARELLPDLLVLDVKMPGLDGFRVLETIRCEPLLERLPVTVLTGCDAVGEVSRGSALRADDYVVKPVSPTVLLNRIKRVAAAAMPDGLRGAPGVRPAATTLETKPPDGSPPASAAQRPDFDAGFAALRAQYLENRVSELAALADALRRADFPALSRAGHNLKGTGAAYGFVELTELGRQLESAAKAEDAQLVESVMAKTGSYLARAQAAPSPR